MSDMLKPAHEMLMVLCKSADQQTEACEVKVYPQCISEDELKAKKLKSKRRGGEGLKLLTWERVEVCD